MVFEIDYHTSLGMRQNRYEVISTVDQGGSGNHPGNESMRTSGLGIRL